jgi:hypothetical protein
VPWIRSPPTADESLIHKFCIFKIKFCYLPAHIQNVFMPDDQNRKVFFISPIGQDGTEIRRKADQTLKHLVRKALEPEPLNCKVDRADEDTDPGSITPRMLNAITTADLVVIDLTDHNPNVFYEMAIAHGYRLPCVHIITEGQKIPFDVKDMNTVEYSLADPDKLEAAATRLRAYAKTALENGTTTTPLSAAERFSVIQSSADPTVEVLADVAARLGHIEDTLFFDPLRHDRDLVPPGAQPMSPETRIALKNYDNLIRHEGVDEVGLDWATGTLVDRSGGSAIAVLCEPGFTPATR